MVKQYSHIVTIQVQPTASAQDTDGNLLAATDSPFQFSGRFETNVRGLFLRAADGTEIVYSGIVYAPLSAPNIPLGTSIVVTTAEGQTKARGRVMQFSRDGFNVRAWIG